MGEGWNTRWKSGAISGWKEEQKMGKQITVHWEQFYDSYPMDCSPPGSFVPGIFQPRVLKRIAISFSRGSSWPRDRTRVSCIAGGFFTNWAIREAHEGQSGLLSLPMYGGIPSKMTLTETPGIIFDQMVQSSQYIIMKWTITDFRWNYRTPKDKS